MSAAYVLEMNGITKTYAGNAVLKDVTMRVKPGEIHALLGENGAGKSTLMNVLFGMPVIHTTGGFQGQILLDGSEVSIASPHEAMGKGIGMVHQEFMLIPGLTITENIKLNRETTKPTLLSRVFGRSMEKLDMPAMDRDARTALDKVGLGIEEYTMIKGLPVGYMQFVEIAREIDKTGIKLLVFDEPTAVLTESEAEQLIGVMRQIAQSGIAIIFITHRLDEVMAAADSITILRDGSLVATRERENTHVAELAELMIGREGKAIVDVPPRQEPIGEDTALQVKGLQVEMPGERVNGVDFSVRKGEILGIGGLAGQGKIGIPNGIMGLYSASGEVRLFGEPLTLNNAGQALKNGLAMVSEDRRGVGLLLDESIEDNIAFNAMQIQETFLKPMLPDPAPLRRKPLLALLLVIAGIGLFLLGLWGNTFWPKEPVKPQAQAETQLDTQPQAQSDTQLETQPQAPAEVSDAEVPLDDLAMMEEERPALLDAPAIARISPLFLILGFLGVLSFVYVLLYPAAGGLFRRVKVKDIKAIRRYAQGMIQRLDIRCTSSMQHAGTLSGGNQQKVCVARALSLKPKLLFVSEPTRGIDIGAKKLVLETLVSLNREEGMTIVMVSSELMELRSICDRIAIISEGRVVDTLSPKASDVDFGLAMSGVRMKAEEASI